VGAIRVQAFGSFRHDIAERQHLGPGKKLSSLWTIYNVRAVVPPVECDNFGRNTI